MSWLCRLLRRLGFMDPLRVPTGRKLKARIGRRYVRETFPLEPECDE